jgi:uncharacterized Zn-binding protein involved in type VI secretion
MPGQPAARKGDKILCTLPNPPLAPPKPPTYPVHAPAGKPIDVPQDHKVKIDGELAARIGDMSKCDGPETPDMIPNPIVKGSIPVKIGGKPAARMTDNAGHGMTIMPPCCPTVLIGLAGVGGNPWEGEAACEKAKAGRKGQSDGQNYGNCGLESARQIINQANGTNVTEKQLLQQAINNGHADYAPGMPAEEIGGTSPFDRMEVLTENNVASAEVASNMGNIGTAVSNGQGVIASVNAGQLWTAQQLQGTGIAPGTAAGGHAITVTGVEYDDDGNIVAVYYNDTGTGKCMEKVTKQKFENALRPGRNLNVTINPIW